MNKKQLFFIGLGVLLIATLTGGLTFFGKKRLMSCHSPQGTELQKAQMSLDGLHLTKEQKIGLKPHEEALKKELAALQTKIAEKRISLCSLLNSKADEKDILSSVEEVGALETKQQKLIVQHIMAMRELLTKDQRDQFFNSMMTTICQSCRTGSCDKNQKCLCGHCQV